MYLTNNLLDCSRNGACPAWCECVEQSAGVELRRTLTDIKCAANGSKPLFALKMETWSAAAQSFSSSLEFT